MARFALGVFFFGRGGGGEAGTGWWFQIVFMFSPQKLEKNDPI